jgi:hypothetical protein
MTRFIGIIFLLTLCNQLAQGQGRLEKWKIQEVHVANKVGWGFPIGKTGDVLTPKYSTSMGLDISLVNPRFFLNPFLDFLAYDYDQIVQDPEFVHQLENGKGSIFALNLAGGLRNRNAKWGTYVYAGPSLSVVTEPRAELHPSNDRVVLSNKRIWGPALRAGAGADYKLGNVFLFVETGYLLHSAKMQDRPIQVLSIYGGLKTNITRVADKVVEIITQEPSGTN